MVVAAIIGYLIGSIPIAVVAGRGTGDKHAIAVLIGDIAKGALAVYAGSLIWGPWWTAYDALAFAVIGNAFPMFAKARGGHPVLTFAGGMLMLSPIPAIIAIGVSVITALLTRRAIYAVSIGLVAFLLVQMFFDSSARVVWSLVLIAFIGLRQLANTPSELVAEHAH